MSDDFALFIAVIEAFNVKRMKVYSYVQTDRDSNFVEASLLK